MRCATENLASAVYLLPPAALVLVPAPALALALLKSQVPSPVPTGVGPHLWARAVVYARILSRVRSADQVPRAYPSFVPCGICERVKGSNVRLCKDAPLEVRRCIERPPSLQDWSHVRSS